MSNCEEISTYLGQKGYSIYKDCISVSEQQWLREELTVRPYIPKSPVQPPSFPIYKESPNKLYIPRFFGNETYGFPDEDRNDKYIPINIEFNGELRDYQTNIVNLYCSQIKTNGGGGLLEIPCGRGKTVIALNIISQVKVKTLVIVHKGFLLNQWVERIKDFLPTARVGKIQGQIIDTENKDIVIGMLQSLSMKEYPTDMFAEYGLTIVDECHHISSEIFCRSLQKIVTKYTLGLSATMQRKDGLTRVFKMFLGDIIYKEKREATDNVIVKSIKYITDDDEFNETKYDFRGNVQHSSMISKLCAYNRRSEFIIKVLETELKEKEGQQIMILAQNKNVLNYLFKAIEHRRIATVGYYIGGMKEEDLKVSERKTIIIATYAMAAEALDIKTLTTLILATPRSDVIQAVGRILRVKHERPLVIDIVDSHEVFCKQWMKRFAFYKKNKYLTLQSDNEKYESNNWEILYDPKNAKKYKKTKNNEFGKGKCLITIS